MDTVLIVIVVVLLLLVLVALFGALSAQRRNRAGAEAFSESLTAVDRELAAATAEDHGWQRDTLNAAARAAYAQHRPGVEPTTIELTRIVDEPGTDSDLAIYRIIAPDGVTELTLGRRDGEWYPKSVADER